MSIATKNRAATRDIILPRADDFPKDALFQIVTVKDGIEKRGGVMNADHAIDWLLSFNLHAHTAWAYARELPGVKVDGLD